MAAAGLLSAVVAVSLHVTPGGALLWTGVAIQTAATPVLLFRRRAPFAVTIAVMAVALILVAPWPFAGGALFPFFGSMDQWVPAALIVAGTTTLPDLHGARAGSALAALGVVTVAATRPWDPSLVVVATGLLHTAGPTLVGLYVTARRRLIRALRDRADRAEREHVLIAQRARSEERARMAAEMHDVVSHRVSLMVLQAGALGVTAPDEATRRAAEELRRGGCQALEELRDVIGLLTGGAGAPDVQAAPDLAGVVAESEAVGVRIDLVEEGSPALDSPVVGRTAQRVVQEALTNVRKHAPGAAVTVRVQHAVDGMRLTVRNTAPARGSELGLAATGSGAGLAGLRHRLDLIGGSLQAGPTGDGGFQVVAVLPASVPTDAAQPPDPIVDGAAQRGAG